MKNARKAGKTTEDEGLRPMDPSIPESDTAAPASNTQRVCWALKTLREEVWSLFPETPVEYSNPDGRNAMLDATFDITVHDTETQAEFVAMINLLADDRRVDTIAHTEGAVLVSMPRNPRTQDSREPFGLWQAHAVLSGEDDEGDDETWEGGDAASTSEDFVNGGGA